MDSSSDDDRPHIKRSKSEQGVGHPTIEVTADNDSSDASALSAPSRIEGNEEVGSASEDDDADSVHSSLFEDVMDEAEDRPYCAQGKSTLIMVSMVDELTYLKMTGRKPAQSRRQSNFELAFAA